MGTLYVVATPIGNLKDITLRAIETLKGVDLVVCEDTRVFGKLAKVYSIENNLAVVNDFNETSQIPKIVADLSAGRNVALVCDAGTPLVSDPGYKLVRSAIEAGIRIESIPGPTAVIAALTLSGKAPDKFMFLGYLPKNAGKRKKVLEHLSSITQIMKLTIIFYESPYRLLKTLEDMKEIFGDIEIVICREMTKMYEEIRREKISESIAHFQKTKPKGELTIVF